MRQTFITAAAVLAIASPAAAAVRYEFMRTSLAEASFSLTLDDFIAGPLEVDVADLDSCFVMSGGPCLGADFVPGGPVGDRVGIVYLPPGTVGAESFFYFPAGSFTTAGVHATIPGPFNEGELRVTAFKDGGAVPEPAAWALMIAGFGLAGAMVRRRRVRPAGA